VTRLAVFVATVAYCGYFPIAPGTVGSAAGLVVYGLLRWTPAPLAEPFAIALTFVVGSWAATHAERFFGGIDPGPVVIDEVLGMVFTMFGNPLTLVSFTAGFVMFRAADVIKPFPAAWIDRNMRNGAGVMLDDLAAAVYANVLLHFVALLMRP